MSVLAKIADATHERLKAAQAELPLAALQAKLQQAAEQGQLRPTYDFAAAFAQPPAEQAGDFRVIAEVKLASPSQGPIAPDLKPVAVAQDYLAHGATALSVLTEPQFFGGSLAYLQAIREACPDARLLMKDFVLDPYQLLQGRLAGADACLLIVAMLEDQQLQHLHAAALELGLTPLVEVHNQQELERALKLELRLLGVNNRNLKTLSTDLLTSRELAATLPAKLRGLPLICESGLSSGQDLKTAASWGYSGFLIGTHLMATGQPGAALAALLQAARA